MRKCIRFVAVGLLVGVLGAVSLASVSASRHGPVEVDELCYKPSNNTVSMNQNCHDRLTIDVDAGAVLHVHRVTGVVYWLPNVDADPCDERGRSLYCTVEVTGDGSVEGFAYNRVTGLLYYGKTSRYLQPILL